MQFLHQPVHILKNRSRLGQIGHSHPGITQAPHFFEICHTVVHSIGFGIGFLCLLHQLLPPGNSHVIIPGNAFTVVIHGYQLFDCLRQAGFCRTCDQLHCPGVIHFHIHAAQIGQADEEIVHGILVIFPDGQIPQGCQHSAGQLRLIRGIHHSGQTRITVGQRCLIRSHHFRRQDGLSRFHSHGILGTHDIVVFVDQIGGHRQHEQAALFQCCLDGCIKILAGNQKFVIPNGNIPADRVTMEHAHQFLGILPILFPIAEENIGIKGCADLGRHFITHQHRTQVGFQFLFKRDRSGVLVLFVQELQIAEFLLILSLQALALHQRQDRDMMRQRIRNIRIHGLVFQVQQLLGDGDHQHLHLTQIQIMLLIGRSRARRIVKNSTITDLQDLLGDLLKIFRKIPLMAGEIHSGLTLGACLTSGFVQ